MPATAPLRTAFHLRRGQPRRIASFLPWLAAGLLIACHAAARADGGAPPPDTGTATVEVDNRGFTDMTVFVLDGARREQLGIASGHSTTSFTIPARLVRGATTLKFICDPIGGRALPVTEEILVNAGDILSLIILEH